MKLKIFKKFFLMLLYTKASFITWCDADKTCSDKPFLFYEIRQQKRITHKLCNKFIYRNLQIKKPML